MDSKERATELLDKDVLALATSIIEEGIGQECFRTLNTSARNILIQTIGNELQNRKPESAKVKLKSRQAM